jgi:hypothetical protein
MSVVEGDLVGEVAHHAARDRNTKFGAGYRRRGTER